MAAGGDGRTDRWHEAVTDFVELIAKALLSGVAAAVGLALAILVLSGGAQAAPSTLADPKTGALLLRTATPGRYDEAPRVSMEVAIEVNGMIARTRVTQVFHNPGAEFVEGLYVFPLPQQAAVDRLSMRIGERLIEGRIQEREEARRTYESARAEGRKASLVEQVRPNLFTNSVAHIGPGEEVVVSIEYQQALAFDDGRYGLRFPLAVTPRYVPPLPDDALPDEPKAAEARAALPHPDYEAPPVVGMVNPVDIAVRIDAGVPLASVVSSYHEALVEKSGRDAVMVMLRKPQEEADRDFELTWTVAPGAAPRASLFLQRGGDLDYALLMVVPPRPTAEERRGFERMPRETILIVDTSGSMQGTSIEQARLAVEQGLRTLTPRDRFNVIEFNDRIRLLFPAAVAATGANVSEAIDWVRRLKADGGTNMAPALAFALDGRETPGHLRQVVFITDGAVGNEDELFGLISRKLGASRLFTVGIGSAPNGHFMAKAAQFGRGTFTYIGDTREVAAKVGELFARIEAPVLRDVQVRWPDGTPVETFPARVPDLYLGEPIVLAAAAKGPLGTVVVSGLRGNQPWSVALTPDPAASAAGVGALWARAKIATLMDELRRGADASQVKSAVVKVALEHHLVSSYTSLVAVDVTPTNAGGEARSALVKASLPLGSAPALAMPQTATSASLQSIVGLLMLLAAAALALAGRRTEARA